MTYPPQQPDAWQDPSWPPQQQAQPQPYADPYGGAPTSPSYAVPAGSPVTYPPTYPAYAYGAPMPIGQKTNSLAITAMVLALTGLACGLTSPIGAIMGHVARRQIRQRGEGGDGMALAGIIVGWILTGLWLAYIAFLIVMIVLAARTPSTTY
jgi:Domain of unknown function (DUF4190)